MKFRWMSVLVILLLASAALGASPVVSRAPDGWTTVATGVDYQVFHLVSPRPINVFVARMNRGNPAVTLDTGIAQGSLVDGRETVRNMAARYDQALNYWGQGWGSRNRVAVAINGYFFNLSSGTPLSGQIQSGWYVQRFGDFVGDAGFAWGLNRNAFIGDCVYHVAANQVLTDLDSGTTQKIHGVNAPRGDDELILYTPQYDATTNTDNSGVEILVEMSRPSLILPGPGMVEGVVRRIRDQRGSTPIPFGHVVLSATGLIRSKLLNRIAVGDKIGISQEVTDCPGSTAKYWTKTYAGMGGDYHFLSGGVVKTDFGNGDAAVPNSRTAIAYNAYYVYFIVVDGWNRGVSEGMKIVELANFARNVLLATDGVSLDSGGSSTMVINGQVVNNTYCNFTRDCGMKPEGGALSSRSAAETGPDSAPGHSVDGAAPTLEPLVGNAMMMVVVDPMAQSMTYKPTQSVVMTRQAALRLGPGTNYAALTTLPANSEGMVVNLFYNSLNGVLAKGSYWWKVYFGGSEGWMEEGALRAGVTPALELWAVNDGPTLPGEVTTLRAVLSDGSDRTFTWDLGDGTSDSGGVITHTYQQKGIYLATVTTDVGPTFLRANTLVIVTDCPLTCIAYMPFIGR